MAGAIRDGELRPVAMIGIDPDRPSLQLAELDQLASTTSADHVLIDDATRADYGPVNQKRFTSADVGT